MLTDDELQELWDTASTVKTSSFELDEFDHAKGLRAVYEAGVAAEQERCARIAETTWPSGRLNGRGIVIAAAIRADREPEPETEEEE